MMSALRYAISLVCALAVCVSPATASQAQSAPEFVGLMFPRGGTATQFEQGKFAGATFDVYVQVYKKGVTEAAGPNRAVKCFLHWGRYGAPWADVPMTWHKQIGNNDEYRARLPRAQLNKLALGRHGFTAYCTSGNEKDKRWRQDSTDINGKQGDNDIGDGQLIVGAQTDTTPEKTGGVIVHLFEWRWDDIARECAWLGQKGYWAVQVSPPTEHVIPRAAMGSPDNAYPWWVRYQPVTHDVSKFTSRSGTLAQFKAMVAACDAAGVGIIVDAVINHTTGVGSGTGTAGSTYKPYEYPQYTSADFHACNTPDRDIKSYQDRTQVQTCELVNLADLDTGSPKVRATLRKFLQDVLDLGVLGFRIDAAKHVAADDIAELVGGLKRTNGSPPYLFLEVIESSGEPIKAAEYLPYGDVTDFAFSREVGAAFNNCQGVALGMLSTLTKTLLPAAQSVVFTDNHDNQRGHGAGGGCVLDHRDGFALYNLGNIFMLGFPHGHPSVMSSYYWSNDPRSNKGDSKGPPSANAPFVSGSGAETRPVYASGQAAGEKPANCADAFEDGKWVCEHRRTAIANMVAFRAATAGEGLSNWQVIGDRFSNHIAFGRGAKGFVAINRTDKPAITTYQTSMPAGRYCNVTRFDYAQGACLDPATRQPVPDAALITVGADGAIKDQTLGALEAIAIHVGAVVR